MMKLVYRLSSMLLVWSIAAIFGPQSVMVLGGGIIVLIAAIALVVMYDSYKIRQFRRKGCDDAILYAQKKRSAFGDSDYSYSELTKMKALRRKGDFKQVYALISASNLRLLQKQQSEKRMAMADKFSVQRIESEVRQHRA